jgi:hypothetical protein
MHHSTHSYRRTPLPASAVMPVWLIFGLWMLIVFSPFVAFSVNGRVSDEDWTPAFLTAGASLAVIGFLTARSMWYYFRLPAQLRAEYSRGRVMMPVRGYVQSGGFSFVAGRHKAAVVELRPAGVRISGAALGRSAPEKARAKAGTRAKALRLDGKRHRSLTLGWSDIREWQVREDLHGRNCYQLQLAHGRRIDVLAPDDAETEAQVLDHVRSVGFCPVRLLRDVE